jgi:hypothetical protein
MARLATLRKGANQHTEISAPTQAQAAKALNMSVDKAKNGPAKANSARAANRAQGKGTNNINDNLSVTSDTAKKTGQNVRQVQRDARRCEQIGAEYRAGEHSVRGGLGPCRFACCRA